MTDPKGIDPRGPRFTAAVTVVLMVAALLSPQPVALAIVAVQAVFFAIGAGLGVHRTPTGSVFRTFVRPRLSAPSELEDPRPPRFAQGLGLVFMAVALLGYVADTLLVAQIAIGMALVAAILNAGFSFCLGCELYLLGLRLTRRASV